MIYRHLNCHSRESAELEVYLTCKGVVFETSNHYPVTSTCHVLEHSNNEVCIQCNDDKLWVLEYIFACVYEYVYLVCTVILYTCVYTQTCAHVHTHVFSFQTI